MMYEELFADYVPEEKRRYVWGLDLSLACSGIAIYDLVEKKWVLVDAFMTNKVRTREGLDLLSMKLRKVSKYFSGYLKEYPPCLVGIERPYIPMGSKNSKPKLGSSEAIYRVHGVVNEILAPIPQFYYPPTSIKATIIHGRATKDLLQEAILMNYPELQHLLHFDVKYGGTIAKPKLVDEDESDAVGAAICAMNELGLRKWTKPQIANVLSETKEKKKKKESKK